MAPRPRFLLFNPDQFRSDAQFALLRETLAERGFWEDTAVFVLRDHGDHGLE
jgi:arylsulfatase A-like enzyme